VLPLSGIFNGGHGLGVIAIVALVFVIAMVLLSRLIRRDPDVRSTKFGFYVEREHYSDEKPLSLPQSDEATLPWPAVPPKEGK
jgi:hypothetical protein